MKDVVDPELGINVVDLGLVYGIHLDDDTNAGDRHDPDLGGLPADRRHQDQTNQALEGLVNDVSINWVWMPPWGPDKINRRRPRPAARARLQRLSDARTSATGGPVVRSRLHRHLRQRGQLGQRP
jgi:metal-sulfur cluster biosynthetic enzyme